MTIDSTYWDVYAAKTVTVQVKKYWTEFNNMGFTIPAYDKPMKVFIIIQLPVQAYWNKEIDNKKTYWISCAYGVYGISTPTGIKEVKLVGSMQESCYGSGEVDTPESLVTLITAIEVPASTKERNFLILGTRRNQSKTGLTDSKDVKYTKMYMGAPLSKSANDTTFKRMTMRVDFFEQN